MNAIAKIAEASSNGTQLLTRTLALLDAIANNPRPMSPTELADQLGLNRSTVSRILLTLERSGFLEKPDYRHYSIGPGLFDFAQRAIHHYPLVDAARGAIWQLDRSMPSMWVVLGMLWRREVLYLARGHNHMLQSGPHDRFPLHLSSIGLRLALELPYSEAIATLNYSRETQGWERRTELVPENPEETLRTAQQLVRDDVLVLEGWLKPNHFSAAIPLRRDGTPVGALALTGGTDEVEMSNVIEQLKLSAERIEEKLDG